MAFAVGGAGERVKMFLRFLDNKGQKPVWRQFDVKWDTDLATTIANAVAAADVIALVTGMECSLGHVQVEIVDAVAVGAEAGSTRFEDGIFTMVLDTTGEGKTPYGNVRIPFPKATLRSNPTGQGYWQLNTSDAAITNLVALYTAAGDLSLNDGQIADSLQGAKVVPVKGKVI